MKTYTALIELQFADVTIPAGGDVDLDEETAAPLIADGIIAEEPPETDPEPGAAPAVHDVLGTALQALGRATPEEVRAFARAMADDPVIAGALTDEPTRESVTVRACEALKAGRDPKSWTSSGAPSVDAVEAVAGLKVSAADRDAAWGVVEAGPD